MIVNMYYLLVFMIDPLPKSSVVDDLPLHMTLVHWFESGAQPAELIATVQAGIRATQPLNLMVEHEAMFGEKKTVRVNRVKRNRDLFELHNKLVNSLSILNVRHTAPQWVETGWQPHVTHKGARHLDHGTKFTCNSVSIVASDDAAHGKRTIVRTLSF